MNRVSKTVPSEPSGPAQLGVRLEQATILERQRALRTLLQHPLLSIDGAKAHEFVLVRRHASWLQDWLTRNPRWRLQVDSELVRLRKTPADPADDARPARDGKSDAPFTRRRYVMFCLAAAALERADRQTTLGKLADDILAFAAADAALKAAGMVLDLSSRDQRRDLVQVVRFLIELRVLVRVDGDEEQYLSQAGDVLYNVNRLALAALLNVRRGPSTINAGTLDERIAMIVEEIVPDTEEGRNRRLRSKLTRELLDDPVVYYDQLSEDEMAYLRSQRGHLLREIQEATGLIPEVRREGIAMVDDRGDLTDIGIPEEGTDGHVTLLLAEFLAEHARRGSDPLVSFTALHQYTAALIERHRAHWRKDVTQPGAEVVIVEQTIGRLAALRLVRLNDDGVVPLPAIARYGLREVEEPTDDADSPSQSLLFQET
jgi:uncharacterized protein (TIGR02678 family)